MTFTDEREFEDAVVDLLSRHGWEEVLDNPTEQDLIANWAKILFENNRSRDRLGDLPLTDTEMAQITEQITELQTPLRLNEFINGRTVGITRDHPGAPNVGKEISLNIYDRREIAGGQSRYQIARQPKFATTASHLLPSRRGDLMLLINGMPLFHLELKRSGVPVSQACNQIAKYAHEGVYTGLFSLVQIFMGMTPGETLYFANPGPHGTFNPDFYFHWADFNNEPVNEWNRVIRMLLSIPMAHQLIGFYTVADRAAGTLMVMRSYQYYAASRIADKVESHDWSMKDQRGGYIWHTTGSGKTITSFKTAQLIADSRNADKVIFLLDRIELGTQSLANYRSYGGESINVEDTSDADNLLTLLKDDHTVLMVTSIQKMRLINPESTGLADLGRVRDKRIAFIIDEAHRSTFGEMLSTIKRTLPQALFFGFTGTPIHAENQKKDSTTATVFGDELHRYSIADGIRDKNVLGFDPVMVETYRADHIREYVALREAHATNVDEVYSDPQKTAVYTKFMDKGQVPMASTWDDNDVRTKGIEDYLPLSQYDNDDHRRAVASDIANHWVHLSCNSAFHAILATSSIPEAIEYYRIFRDEYPQLTVTALFDPNIDNTGDKQLFKEDGLVEILDDYNKRFRQSFTFSSHSEFKKDVSARLSHKKPYNTRSFTHDQQIDLLIVVDQMLTGFDSKWLNTLYLDKVIEYESIIQAFSRTNRIFGPTKPFGSIRYCRRPYTMQTNVERAVKLYSGDKPFGLFVDHLDQHLRKMNECFEAIEQLFSNSPDFSTLPTAPEDRGEFAKIFSEFYRELLAAQVQGFTWDNDTYHVDGQTIIVEIAEPQFIALVARYKELDDGQPDGGESNEGEEEVPFDIDVHITHIDTDRIDSDYLNGKFTKYLRALAEGLPAKELNELLEELHASFARLSRDDQKYANRWLHDLHAGDVELEPGKSVQDYINVYRLTQRDREITRLTEYVGVDGDRLRRILDAHVTEQTLNEYGRFDDLKDATDLARAKAYYDSASGKPVPKFIIRRSLDSLLRHYILTGQLPADLHVADEIDDEEN
ncbi:type I restriction endonuclease subunit R, EcoR124 family [Corynebacterium sp. A21]|uniref:type I restriction endonuclease subunit R, EcoR124 family n=1 Tax=Corynebacterium sp. A21 TaxID=3457318 RepID=UPI003FD3C084